MADLLGVFWDVFRTSPLLALGGLWWACFAVLSRTAKALKLPPWMAWAGPLAVAYILYRKRQPKYAVFVVVGMWLLVLLVSPSTRVAVGLALPVGGGFGLLVHLVSIHPELPPGLALQAMLIDRRQREVLGDAVPVSAGEGARLVKDSVRVAADGSFEAEIIGPPGVAHADLLESLRLTLAETVYAMSGRRVEHMAVSGSGRVKGRAWVRGSAEDPYRKSMSLDDLRGRQ